MNLQKFNPTWYVNRYPDVAKSKMSPREHYETFGKKEGRFPYPPTMLDYLAVIPVRLKNLAVRLISSFLIHALAILIPGRRVNAEWYLKSYPDVAASGIPPKKHYKYFGRAEGRKPGPPNSLDRLIARIKVIIPAIRYLAKNEGGYIAALNRLVKVYKCEGISSLKTFVIRTFNDQENSNNVSYASWITSNELAPIDFEAAAYFNHNAHLQLQPRMVRGSN